MNEPLGVPEGSAQQLPAHLYVHVPFCASKCSYCDFASISGASDELVSAVFRGIRSQITRWVRSGLDGVLETIYVGGGTPSCHPVRVAETIEHVRASFVVHPNAEITVEGNPDSLHAETIAVFSAAGATRLSVGVQSFDDSVLRLLGRRHDASAAWDACRTAVASGLDLSVDLICGVPGQSMASWSETVERAVATGAAHVSVYPLTIEDGTPLSVAVGGGLVESPDPDVAADMMLLAERILGLHGFSRYEVANYAKGREHESRHNQAYWTGRPYIGIGPGAHGMLDWATAHAAGLIDVNGNDVARVRYGNAPSVDDWLVGTGDTLEVLSAEEAEREDIMLGLRLARGVPVARVEAAGLTAVLESLAADGLTQRYDQPGVTGQWWQTTQRGWLLGNVVFGRVWSGE